ncbi:uncharacterized protein GIQ15_01665 [Arthroderma uncinatum]|uniref:uncharacterized protein n=1 Tax=Arthroderma uncinatum TaxID=74035 RepID=UPI00144A8218|nr:uncharacterized protein GIQ15_01665 [Arthroderma uncinatum]KAF3492148.1 hypothetical protein GIQ15_01665 [Arthroderma uncinatum]
MTTTWGNLRPYENSRGFGMPKGVPRGCELSEVHVLHRHAQRYPAGEPLEFVDKLATYKTAHPRRTIGKGSLKFLNDWENLLGMDTLLATGSSTEATSGANFWNKYARLLYRAGPGVARWNESLNVFPNGTARPHPIFRTTTQDRILESAKWWLSGFFSDTDANGSQDRYSLVVIPEAERFNNTLAPYFSCTKTHHSGSKSRGQWTSTYTKDAVERFSNLLPADFNLTGSNVREMQLLCAYEWTGFGGSNFCSLFTEQEWRDFEYSTDIEFYAESGFGSPVGRAFGIGYVEELVARLERRLLYTSDTSVNVDFDSNATTFPLHQPFYLDMSHDVTILAVLTALGLDYFNHGPRGLPGDVKRVPRHTFKASEVIPFGARLVSEIWTCPCERPSFERLLAVLYKNPSLSQKKCTNNYIRFVLNDAPLPLHGLPRCRHSKKGFCPVNQFARALPALKKEAMYQWACFGNYTAPGHQVGNGHPEELPSA